MLAHVRDLAVRRHRWMNDDTFREGLVLCQSIPGPTVMMMTAYVGQKVRGGWGALFSFVGFGLPAFLLVMGLSMSYAQSRTVAPILAMFSGLQLLVVAIIAHATYVFGRNLLLRPDHILIAGYAALSLLLGANPFWVIAGAAVAGMVLFRKDIPPPIPREETRAAGPSIVGVTLTLLAIIAGLGSLFYINRRLFELAELMLRTNLFAFGGGFATLPLLVHEVVGVHRWLDNATLMDGIALGQVTPGPFSMTAAFIGYMLFGGSGAIVATVAMFAPSLLLVIAITPYHDRLKASSLFYRASKGIASCFVGLLLFIAIRFGGGIVWTPGRVVLGLLAFGALFKGVEVVYVVLGGVIVSLGLF
jgi:chromate transporter